MKAFSNFILVFCERQCDRKLRSRVVEDSREVGSSLQPPIRNESETCTFTTPAVGNHKETY